MALTATAQSALPREPAWDEVIVPALRKRLKDESTVLAKRISAASIGSDEGQPGLYYAPPRPGTSTSNQSHSHKPSAIPRPSLQSSRTADGPYSAGPTSPYQRPRTLSQPFPVDDLASPDPATMYDVRPISPANIPKGTRIPVSRARAGSTSSQGHSMYNGNTGRANGASSYSRHTAEASDSHLWPVEEKSHSHTSRSTVGVPRRKVSDIFQEPAPFSSQSQLDHDVPMPERLSSDSEEHPFEHWYRGDVARNGGVGELRVARRQEMLDIANYGHTLKKASMKHQPSGLSSRSRSNSRGRDMPNGRPRARARADSVGARGSVYIDPDEMQAAGAVMEERPPTDMEDEDGYEDHLADYYQDVVQPHPNGSISSPSLDRSDTPTSRATQNTSRSRIPQPSSRSRTTTPTPGKPTRSASESGVLDSSNLSTTDPRTVSSIKTQGLSPMAPPQSSAMSGSSLSTPSTPTAKRRAKSPAAATPTSAKKPKARAPPSSMQKRANEEKRRSIGQYPQMEGDEDAIPTWTQPKPANGNWDDVVLPAVAKKKGLQDQFEHADGSPKPKEPSPEVYAPAPGTFGYDATKYRRRYDENPEQIPMDEFGQMPSSPATEPHQPQQLGVPIPPDLASLPPSPSPVTPRSLDRSVRAESPPPFSHYSRPDGVSPAPQPHVMSPLAPLPPANKEQYSEDDAGGAGCCKCVIM